MLVWDSELPGNLDTRVHYVTARLSEAYAELNVPSGERVPISKVWDLFKPGKGSRCRRNFDG